MSDSPLDASREGVTYVLLQVPSGLLTRLVAYLRKLRIWYKLFPETAYKVVVTVEERTERLHSMRNSRREGYLNPPASWRTCRHCREIWDWDSLGRGPHVPVDPKKSKAPKGKGWFAGGQWRRARVAGDCKNPPMLNYISCHMWCLDYEPTSVEALTYLEEAVAQEHMRRAEELRGQAELLKTSQLGYEEVIAEGKVWRYEGGRFKTVYSDE